MRLSSQVILTILFLVLMAVLPFSASGEKLAGKKIEKWDFILYLPDTLESGRRYPLLVAFSPGADADGLLQTWNVHARSHRCALYCSKVVRNGMDVPPVLKRIAKQIPELAKEHPIDPALIIGTGVSGGGMTAHLFAFLHPDLVAGVISNVGYIHENSLKKVKTYPRQKVCAFLTSPTDFNYKLMQEDRKFLDGLAWKTRWWEFEGGHRLAPDEISDAALAWVLEQLSPASATPDLHP